VLRQPESPSRIVDAVRALSGEAASGEAVDERGSVLRTHGIGAQILHDLGITTMRVLSAPRQLRSIAAFGLEITGYED
jgi:3,4-dihydroxy 2-butanone 4-phosphate synthase/GTP cyclohydrolase II